MYENVSAIVPPVKDLTIRPLNQLVEESDFVLDAVHRAKYSSYHTMEEEISVARRVCFRQLATRLKYYNRTTNKSDGLNLDMDVDADLLDGLEDALSINPMKIMGALCHPLFNSSKRMIAAGLCTESQYNAGLVELIDRMTEYHSLKDGNDSLPGVPNRGNQWDDNFDDDIGIVTPARKKAEEEWKKFCLNYKHSTKLPEMEPREVLGRIDKDGQPKEPIFAFGPVKCRGEDLPSGKNHADYVDSKGNYDIVGFFKDHTKQLPSLENTFTGKLASHSTSEADCESLFSESGHLAKPHMNRTSIETFERLVIAKHCMARVYCCKHKVLLEFLRRWKSKKFGEKEDRDDLEFWEQEKNIFLEEFPQHDGIFDGLETDESGFKSTEATV